MTPEIELLEEEVRMLLANEKNLRQALIPLQQELQRLKKQEKTFLSQINSCENRRLERERILHQRKLEFRTLQKFEERQKKEQEKRKTPDIISQLSLSDMKRFLQQVQQDNDYESTEYEL